MKKEILNKQFTSYVERMQMVRLLSTPSLDDVKAADEYGRRLRWNFKKIGEYAGENREMLDKVLFPLLEQDRPLSEEEIAELDKLGKQLVDGEHATEIDLHLSELISDCLARDEEHRLEAQKRVGDSLRDRILFLERRIDVAYTRLSYDGRSNPKEWRKLLEEGLVYYDEALAFLEKDVFASLSEELRACLIMLCINGTAMYNTRPQASGDENLEFATKQKEGLDRIRAVLEDPFYLSLIPEETTQKAKLYVMSYVAAFCFLEGLSAELYEESWACALQIEREWNARPDFVESSLYLTSMREILLLSAFRTASPEVERCLKDCIEIYEARDRSDYTDRGTNPNLGLAKSIFLVLCSIKKKDPGKLSEHMEEILYGLPLDVMSYLYKSPHREHLGSYVNVLSQFIEYFEELPGGIRMRNFCIHSMAAMHPPTYVHSNMVAKLTVCMTRHLLSLMPEVFCGFPGCRTAEEVWESKEKIMDYAWHSALYHDIGKLYVIETIAMYGRKLLNSEYELIRSHPDKGAEIAERFDSMKDYVDVIRGHHLWYDGSRGYPEGVDTSKSPYKSIISIVSVADSLDAATDGVGRSYRPGKTLENIKNELKEGSGTRYAPYMAELFEDPATYEDLEYLLKNGRRRMYRDTYFLLKDLIQKNE